MAKKISQLSSASVLNNTDEFEINQGGTSKKVSAATMGVLFGFGVYTGSAGITLTGNNFTLDNSYFTGQATVAAGVVTLTNSAVIGKVLTGYVSGAGTVVATDTILQAINKLNGNQSLYLPLAGGTLTGNLNGVTPTEITYLSGASSNIQTQINNINSGLSWKLAVRVATTANITLSGTQTIDGIAVIAGDRVLVKNQSTGANNGIYVCSAGAWSRSTDATTGTSGTNGILGATVVIEEGTVNADTIYTCSTDAPITIGVTSLVFAKTSATTYTASNGVTLTGNNFTLDNSYFSGAFTLSGGVATIANSYVTNAMLAGSIAASKLIGTDIATVGTITSGTWNGTVISPVYGGTGIANNVASTITISGSFATTFTISATTNATIPSGTNTLYSTKSASITSAQLLASMTDPTGTGVNVFGTSPTFTTGITVNGTILGTGNATLGATSGSNTHTFYCSSGANLITFQPLVGSLTQVALYAGNLTAANDNYMLTGTGTSNYVNSKTTLGLRISNSDIVLVTSTGIAVTGIASISGQTNIGNAVVNPSTTVGLLRLGQGTAIIDIGQVSSAIGGIWFSTGITPSSVNFNITGSQTATSINAPSSSGLINIMTNGSNRISVTHNSITFAPTSAGTGAVTNFTFTAAANSSQTPSTNIPIFKVTGATTTWGSGTIALQYFNWFSSNTVAFGSASTATFVGANVFEYAQGGTNSTITTSAAIYIPTLALTNTTTAYGISVAMPSGATNNHGIQITNGSIPLQGIVLTSLVGTAATGAFYIGVTPSSSNYVLKSDGTSLQIQAPGASSVQILAASNGICTFTTSAITPSVNLAFNNGINVTFATTGGTKLGTATNQLFGAWNATPIAQPANTVAIDTVLANIGFRATGGNANFDTAIVNSLPIRLKNYTVATLPAGTQGDVAYVTDSLTPSFLVAAIGGGTTKAPVFYDGTNWVTF